MYMAKLNVGTYISLETDVGNRMLCSWTAYGIVREVCLRLGYDLLVIEEIGAPRLADLMASTTMALTVSRKQRLRELEKEIRSGMEEFYYTGMKLKEIRDDELYKEDGFETWEKYCLERWELARSHVKRLIIASEYRDKLPKAPSGGHDWSERSVRELTRIPDKKQAARVAAKVVEIDSDETSLIFTSDFPAIDCS